MTTTVDPLQDPQDPGWGGDLDGHGRAEGAAGGRPERGCRSVTYLAHTTAVERVVETMRQRVDAPFSLAAMARVAWLSPYHFIRVFRSITGVPPHTFLTALRMQAAKELLLTTQLRVTDVCFSVGYQSVGTFTTRFKEMVGISPRAFRETSEVDMWALLGALAASDDQRRSGGGHGGTQVVGEVLHPEAPSGPTFVGLFRSRASYGRPAACALLAGPTHYRTTPAPDGRYRVMAAAFEWSTDIRDYLLPKDSRLWVGASHEAVDVRGGRVSGNADVTLRPKRATDPPIVLSFPTSASREPSPALSALSAGISS